jgi:PAS domain S-box-containing protein
MKPYTDVLEALPDAALLVDAHGTVLFANGRAHEMMGYGPGELVGRPVTALVPALRENGTHEAFTKPDVVAKRADGGELPIDLTLSARAPRRGRTLRLCTMRDVTARRQLEARLRETETRWRYFLEHASEVFYQWTDSGQPGGQLFLSPTASAWTGHSVDELQRDYGLCRGLVHPDDRAQVSAATREIVERRREGVREFRVRHDPDGAYRWVEDRIEAEIDDTGRLVRFTGVARDVTDRRLHRRQLEALVRLSAAVPNSTARADVFHAVLDELAGVTEADGVAFAVLDAPGEVRVEAARGVLAGWTGKRLPAVGTAAPLIDPEGGVRVLAGGSNVPLPDRRAAADSAIASAPVRGDGATGALLVVVRRPFDDQEILLLRVFGDLTAMALGCVALRFQVLQESAMLEEACESTIEVWARTLDLRDRVKEGHTRRVTDLTMRLARRMGVAAEQLPHIRRGALLHDIGKIAVPEHILRKPSALDDQERAIMRRHPEYAYDLLGPIEFLRPALEIPYYHHERWDGTGYPRGLKGVAIPLAARIFAVADVYDAITSDRPWEQARSSGEALDFILSESGRHFDPAVVDALVSLVAE